jgi:hypothetical protein
MVQSRLSEAKERNVIPVYRFPKILQPLFPGPATRVLLSYLGG